MSLAGAAALSWILTLGLVGANDAPRTHARSATAIEQHVERRRGPSDAEIRRLLIEESIADYPGNCPCPYNTARNGSSCGRRSAYNREGGYAPLCYPSDVSAEMVREYRATH